MPRAQPFFLAALIATTAIPAWGAAIPVTAVDRQPDGVVLTMQPGIMRLQVWAGDIIRVTYAAGAQLPALKSLSVIAQPAAVKWDLVQTADMLTLQTPTLRRRVDKKTGAVTFLDLTGKTILQETDAGKEIAPAVQQGVEGTLVRQSFILPPDEAVYGLGQHQQGTMNYRGRTVHLQQKNTDIGIPVLLSSKGYALLWDNPAVTDISVGAAGQPGALTWNSESGKAIDYYFLNGPSPDNAIKGYRTLTGDAPMMGNWLWGFWQCKERYRSSDELLSIAKQYRDLKVPIDGIIQDWRYWPDDKPVSYAWGSHTFDKTRYPDPPGTFKQLHDLHFHTLISVWPKFDVGTPNSDELAKAGALYAPIIPYVFPPGKGQWYDPFNPEGRRIYWNQISKQLFSVGVDGWWLDAPEPELSGKWGEFRTSTTADGPGYAVYNAYPLMHSTGIYQGQRAQTSDKRVAILTRSAYAGQQRNAAISWSGDIGGTWQVFRNQIPAGLNFSASGIPYWNTDIGGFFGSANTGNMNPQDPRYQELFSRWFQFGSFCPLFRVHGSAPNGGTGPGKEFWRFDAKTQDMWRTFVNLRYRLMPYIYSTSWQVTSNGYTMMRPLVMDFPDDPQVFNIGDQYLFGPAIMVNPVTTQGADTRSVYLPGKEHMAGESTQTGSWYDFWTGTRVVAGTKIDAAAPVESMPLYIRAGSILPMGPLIQYVDEKPADPIELRIYQGADGTFTLYEDQGDNYNYEKGAFATIPLSWNNAARTLTIGDRKGEFPGMIKERTFNIVFVSAGHGIGVPPTDQPDQIVKFAGQTLTITPSH